MLTSDLQRVGFATQQLLQLIGAGVIAAAHVSAALVISVPITLFAIACGLVFLLLLRPFDRRSDETGWRLRDAMNDLYAALTEHVGGMKIAKSYGLEDVHEQKFQAVTQNITAQMVDFTAANASTRMVYEIGAAVVLALFFYAALEVADLPPAGLLLIVFIFARLLPRFSMIQQTVQRIRNSLPSFTAAMAMERRFERAAEAPSAASPQPLPLDQEIRLRNVGFRYDGENDQWALRNLDLTIPARRVTALAGPPGASGDGRRAMFLKTRSFSMTPSGPT